MRDGPPFSAAVVLTAAFLWTAPAAPAQQIRLENQAGGMAVFRLTGLPLAPAEREHLQVAGPEGWRQILQVRVGHPDRPDERPDHEIPPLAGDYAFTDGAIEFRPRFPLQPGLPYWASTPGFTGRYSIPAATAGPPTTVTQVYPTADLLPENQLKFYLHFSAPMQQGGAYRHLRLDDGNGAPVELPFLELDEELWDRSGTRFTLFIDPGRIKLGVKPREDVGTALTESGRFALVIASTWRDASGRPLAAEFRKEFRVGPADRTSPDPTRWTLRPPHAGTRDPLVVEFGEPLDHALLQRLIWPHHTDGAALAGNAIIGPREASWSFTPAAPWNAGIYEVRAATVLEDLAGNNLARPFDRDLASGAAAPATETVARITFEVRP